MCNCTPAAAPPAVQVRYRLLPSSYRTRLCYSYFDGSCDSEGCPQGAACSNAHSLDELRVDAAIQV